jgi:hypothetical protein
VVEPTKYWIMTDEIRDQLLARAKDFFRNEIVESHIDKACKSASKLHEYNLNPFLYKYLANFLRGNDNPRSIAEALIYPRLLGSSITTSFGMKIQKLISQLFEGFGSTTPGIDIEFIDAIDNRKKYCQIKSGPNTINHDDVDTIFNHFSGTINLARTNNLNIGLNDLIVGVIYGEIENLSSHYHRINEKYQVIVGQDFWYHLTGKEEFYYNLIDSIGEVALEVDGTAILEETIRALEIEIRNEFD